VTNVGYAHAEYFDSIEGVAAAKRELIEALPPAGVAVLNGRRPARAEIPGGAPRPFGDVRLLGTCGGASETAEYGADGACFRAEGVDFETETAWPARGHETCWRRLPVARVFGIAPDRLREPVRTFAAGKMRGQRSQHNGVVVWNDCYNSNPEAAQSMIDVLRQTPAATRIAVLGEMLELGRAAEELHRQVGRYAAGHGADWLIGIGGHAAPWWKRQSPPGFPRGRAQFFEDPAEAGNSRGGRRSRGMPFSSRVLAAYAWRRRWKGFWLN